MQFNPFALLALFSGLLSLALAYQVWQRRPAPGALAFVGLAAACGVYALASSVELSLTRLDTILAVMNIAYPAIFLIPVFWLALVMTIAGRERWLNRFSWPLLLGMPCLILLIAYTNKWHALFHTYESLKQISGYTLIYFETGPWFWVSTVFVDACILGGVALLAWEALQSSGLRRRQINTLLAGVLIPFSAHWVALIYLERVLQVHLDLAPLVLGITSLVYWRALFRQQSFDLTPLARESMLDGLDDAMLTLDVGNRLVDANPAALRMFGWARLPAGLPAAELLAGWSGADSLIDASTSQTFTATKAGHKVQIRLAMLHNKTGQMIGRVLLVHDITESSLVEQNLRTVLDFSPVAIILFDLEGRIQLWNNAAENIYGWTEAEVLGQLLPTVPTDHSHEKLNFERRVLRGETIRYVEVQRQRKDGSSIDISLSVAPLIDASGQIYAQMSLSADITARKQAENELREQLRQNEILRQQLAEQALRDPLTGLFNRRFLNATLQHVMLRAGREHTPLSVVVCDIDHFKTINDTYGHQVGDLFLVEIARLLEKSTRGSDFVCRHGGEEFLLVFPGSSMIATNARAEEIRQKCQENFIMHEGRELRATLSFGVATYPNHGSNPDEIIIKADKAMYISKAKGRNQVTIWEEP